MFLVVFKSDKRSFVAGGFIFLFTSLSRLGSFGSSVLVWRAGETCALTVS